MHKAQGTRLKAQSPVRAMLLVLGCASLASLAGAQGISGSIEGRVADDTGAPLAAATVVAHNRATGLERMTTTDDAGRFVLVSLPVDAEYDVRAQSPGFAMLTRERVRVLPGTTVLDFTLRVGAAATIDVGAEAAPLDRSQSTVRQTVVEDLVRALPLPSRGFLPLASLTAGFTGNPDFPNPHGQMYWTNNVLIDGATHFSKWRTAARAFASGLPLEAVGEVQVLSALFSAEFGESLASVTSVRTRTGTNQWHGSALLFVRDSALDAPPTFSTRKPSGGGQQFGFSIGGPLVVNRTHFFAAYEQRRARDHNVVVSPAAPDVNVPNDQDDHLPFFRVDHQRQGQLLTARYSGQFFHWHQEPGGLSLPGAGTDYTTNVNTALVTSGLPIGTRTLQEARFQVSRFVDRRRDLAPRVFVSRSGYSTEGGTIGPSGFGVDPEDTWEISDTISHTRAAHTGRLGATLKYVRARNTGVPYGWGAYFFAGPPEQASQPYLFIQSFAPGADALLAAPRSVALSGFAQDDWTVRSRLRLTVGVRYDLEHIGNVQGFDIAADKNNVQPRGGFALALDEDGRTMVRGGAGIYTQQHLLFPISRVELEGAEGATTVNLPPDSPNFPRFPAPLAALPSPIPARDLQRVDQRFKNGYAVQAAAGVQRLVAGGVATADVIYLNGRDLMSLIDVNAPASISKLATRTVAQADLTRSIVPGPGGLRKLITLGNEGESWYRALEMKFERFRSGLQLIGSYTLSRAEDMANYELPEDSRNIRAEKARASTDVRHNVVTAFMWTVPGSRPLTRGWSVAGIGTFRSNRPYTITWGDDRFGTTQNDARPGARNTGTTDSYRTVDLSITRRFQHRAATIEARLDGFNAFNTTNFDQYVGELISPLFGRPVSAFPSRRIELAAIVRF
jgi:hypothetical protein